MIHTDTDPTDWHAMWKRRGERLERLAAIGKAQAEELARVREERDMLARKAAEMAHELIALKYPRRAA